MYLLSFTKVKIGDSNHCIYVNGQTNKGRQLVASDGMLHPKVTELWRTAATKFFPNLVLDIGAGYGDVLFSTEYNQEAKIVGIEANKEYEPWFIQSQNEHFNRKQIELKYSLGQLESTEIKCRKLLFKMNLHGNEREGLITLEKLTKSCEAVLGILDFNSIYLEENGTRIDEFLSYVKAHYEVFVLKSTNKLIKLQPLTYPILKRTLKKPYIITDLLLVSDANLVSLLGYKRSINYLDRGQYYLKD